MTEEITGSGEMFPGVFKTLGAVKKCLQSKKYINLEEVQQLLQICEKYPPCEEVVDKSDRKLFIVLEGIDAAGKTTIGRRLANLLNGCVLSTPPKVLCENGMREKFDRHPEELRRAYYALGNYIAAFEVKQLYKTRHIVMDRFWHSSAAYAIAVESIRNLSGEVPSADHDVFKWPSDLLKPDVVFFLSVSEEVRIKRLTNRKSKPITEEELKMKDDLPLRNALTTAYSQMRNPSQNVLDSNVSVEEVLEQLKSILEKDFLLQLPKIEKYYPGKTIG